MRGRTVIVISHRLDVVRAADHVVVLEGARVVQAGSPDALEAAGGAFATLFLGPARPSLAT
jgi:ATP-binding cassette subfamily B protein